MKLLILIVPVFLFVYVGCTNEEPEIAQPEEEIKNEAVVDIQDNKSEEIPEDTEEVEDDNSDLGSLEFKTSKNKPPKMRSIRIVTLTNNPQDGFQAIATAVDPDGDPVNFIYQWKYNDEDIVGATEDILEWREDFKKGGKISIEVIPFDDEAQGVWKSEGNITVPNSPPSFETDPPATAEDGKFYYEYSAKDPDGDEIRYTLNNAPEGMVLNTSSKVIEWVFTEKNKGNYNVEFVVSDNEGAKSSQLLDITIIPTVIN